jgi:hypothetical protein
LPYHLATAPPRKGYSQNSALGCSKSIQALSSLMLASLAPMAAANRFGRLRHV